MKGTLHTTPVGDLVFVAVARPIKNTRSGKDEYVVRLCFDGTTPEGMTFKKKIHQINNGKVVNSKVDADGNETLKPGHFLVSFSSTYVPIVIGEDGATLEGHDVPFLDLRKDSGQAVATFIVGPEIKGSQNPPYIRLAGVKFINLKLAPKEGGISNVDEIKAKLAALGK